MTHQGTEAIDFMKPFHMKSAMVNLNSLIANSIHLNFSSSYLAGTLWKYLFDFFHQYDGLNKELARQYNIDDIQKLLYLWAIKVMPTFIFCGDAGKSIKSIEFFKNNSGDAVIKVAQGGSAGAVRVVFLHYSAEANLRRTARYPDLLEMNDYERTVYYYLVIIRQAFNYLSLTDDNIFSVLSKLTSYVFRVIHSEYGLIPLYFDKRYKSTVRIMPIMLNYISTKGKDWIQRKNNQWLFTDESNQYSLIGVYYYPSYIITQIQRKLLGD